MQNLYVSHKASPPPPPLHLTLLLVSEMLDFVPCKRPLPHLHLGPQVAPRALFVNQSMQPCYDWCTYGRWWQLQTSLGRVTAWRWDASWSCSPSEGLRLRQSRQSGSVLLHLPTQAWSHRDQQLSCRCSPVLSSSAYP